MTVVKTPCSFATDENNSTDSTDSTDEEKDTIDEPTDSKKKMFRKDSNISAKEVAAAYEKSKKHKLSPQDDPRKDRIRSRGN